MSVIKSASIILIFIMYCVADQNENCGLTIVHRTPTFVASLQATDGDHQRHVCSASIVHERYLLTAASCFYKPTGQLYKELKKALISDGSSNGGLYYDIQEYFTHYKFFLQTSNYDVGLVKLVERVHFSPRVGKIGLVDHKTVVHVGDTLHVAGWRYIDPQDANSSDLNVTSTSVEVVPRDSCRVLSLGRIVTSAMMCGELAGKERAADTGAPLYLDRVQIGVASRQTSGLNPALFTQINSTRLWILNVINNRN